MRNSAFVALLWLGVLPAAPSVAQSTNAPAAKQVLFVCTGNSDRSPLAEYLFKSMMADNPKFLIQSRGTAAYAS